MEFGFEVYKDDDKKEIIIYNEIFYYGPLATQEIVERISADIENNWNEPQGIVQIQGLSYRVKFIIKGELRPFLEQEWVENNPYPFRKFFKVVENTHLDISFVDGLHSNTGQFKWKNIAQPNSKTGPHELGHTWGLEHPIETDYRGKGQPHIMLPRGSFVDPEFRYKAEAELITVEGKTLMQEGFTIDTNKRKVLQLNIDELGLDKLHYSSEGYSTLSGLSNKFYGLE